MEEQITILIVDDDENTRRTMTLIFGAHGYEVETAATGQEALAKAGQRFFNVALLDIKLPDMAGVELLAPLQEIQPDLVVIMVTAYASVETAVRALNEGASAYINKPVNMDELQALLHQALEKQRLIIENRRLLEAVQQELTERKRAEAETRRRNRELSLLNQIIAASMAGTDVEGILETACRELGRAFNLPQAAAVLLNEAKTEGRVVAAHRPVDRQSILNKPIPLKGSDVFKHLIANQGPLVIEDALQDQRLESVRDLLNLQECRSVVMLPLVVEGEMMGSLTLGAAEARAFPAPEVSLAWSVADQVAGVLARSRLAETQRRLVTAIEQTTESVVITDAEGRIQYVNPAFERSSGYEAAEVIGQNPRIVKSGKHDDSFYQELWGTITAGRVWQGRFINRRKDGALYTENATISPVRDQNGAIVNYVAVKRDVTHELQLEEQYRQVVSSISDHIYVTEVTEDGRRLNRYLSPNVVALTGYPYEKFIDDWNFWPSTVIHAEDRQLAAQQTELLVSGQNSETEYRMVRADGRIIWVRDSGRVEAGNGSKTIYGVVSNITQRKQAEEEIKSRARQQAVVAELGHLALAGMALSDLMAKTVKLLAETFEVEFCKILEYLPNGKTLLLRAAVGWEEDTLGRTTLAAKVDSLAGFTLQTNEPVIVEDFNQETRFKLPSWLAQQGVVSGMSVVIRGREEPIGVLAVHTTGKRIFSHDDINFLQTTANLLGIAFEKQQADAALKKERASLAQRVRERTAELSRANAELTRATRLKDEFLANMSHELRTPLNAILGMSEVLNMKVYGPLNDEQHNAVKHIAESGQHLLTLINDILDLSKIEAGKLELEIGTVTVEDVCQLSFRFVKQMAQQKRIKTTFSIDQAATKIQADERRLKQILVNLLSNAVKFTQEGGEVGLEVENDEEQGIVRFSVWDTGIGISEEGLEQLFKPFIQLDSSLARHHEGTGLGLSLVSRLAELHGGGVSVVSTVDQGSRFTVSLPRRQLLMKPGPSADEEQSPDRVKAIFPPAGGAAPLILVAEDNETNIIMLRDLLQSSGYRVTAARSGAEALARAREEKPDLILMDIQMPGIDGLEAIRILRADGNLGTVPIIALTALAMSGDRERCLAAGADEYLSKPFAMEGLMQMIMTYLQQDKQRQPEAGDAV